MENRTNARNLFEEQERSRPLPTVKALLREQPEMDFRQIRIPVPNAPQREPIKRHVRYTAE